MKDLRFFRTIFSNLLISEIIKLGSIILLSHSLRKLTYRFKWKIRLTSTHITKDRPSGLHFKNRVSRTSNNSRKLMRHSTIWSSTLVLKTNLNSTQEMNKSTLKLYLYWLKRQEDAQNVQSQSQIFTNLWSQENLQ